MEIIDRKYRFEAVSISSGRKHSEKDAMIFLAEDKLLPEVLDFYAELCVRYNVDRRQLEGVKLVKERVLKYQEKHANKVDLPDVKEGKEYKRVCKPNR